MKILHLTDLHVKSAKNGNEALRKAFYKTYLKSFIGKIKHESIDKIFITGDFIRAEKDNPKTEEKFEHVYQIIEHILEATNLSTRDVFITNGNHDVCRSTGDIRSYENFLSKIESMDDVLDKGEYFTLYRINKNDAVLTLNSIGKNHSSGYPNHEDALRVYDREWLDNVILRIEEFEIEDLYVLSHHPVNEGNLLHRCSRDENKEGKIWFHKHVWLNGNLLLERLKSNESVKGNIYCFSGDVHLEDYSYKEGFYYSLVTGSFNYFSDWETDIPSQASIFSSLDTSRVKLYFYNLSTHNSEDMDGTWEYRWLNGPKVEADNSAQNKIAEISEPEECTTSDTIDDQVGEDQLKSLTVSRDINIKADALINYFENLDSDICDFIKTQNLYKVGRFLTNDQFSSLIWISIGRVLAESRFFSDIIESFRLKFKDIEKQLEGSENKDFLFIGLNNLGGALATRLGAGTNVRSCCIGHRHSYDEIESVNQELKHIVAKKKYLIFVSDVIATGYTLVDLKKQLGVSAETKVYSFAVMFDSSQYRFEYSDHFKVTYTVCSSFKMPIIENSNLPESDVFTVDMRLG